MRRLGGESAGVPFIRQDAQPDVAVDGAEWVTDADGSGGDTTSFYVYNALTEAWELERAVGPSEPDAGTPVAGATWRDTNNGVAKQYDGSSFIDLSVSNHGDLDNVTPSQHHDPPTSESGNMGNPFDEDLVPVGAYVETITHRNGGGGAASSLTVYGPGGSTNYTTDNTDTVNISGFVTSYTIENQGVVDDIEIKYSKP